MPPPAPLSVRRPGHSHWRGVLRCRASQARMRSVARPRRATFGLADVEPAEVLASGSS